MQSTLHKQQNSIFGGSSAFKSSWIGSYSPKATSLISNGHTIYTEPLNQIYLVGVIYLYSVVLIGQVNWLGSQRHGSPKGKRNWDQFSRGNHALSF